MKARLFPVIVSVLLAGIILLDLSDTGISVADIGVPDNEVPSSEGNNASATATTTITMTGVPNE